MKAQALIGGTTYGPDALKGDLEGVRRRLGA